MARHGGPCGLADEREGGGRGEGGAEERWAHEMTLPSTCAASMWSLAASASSLVAYSTYAKPRGRLTCAAKAGGRGAVRLCVSILMRVPTRLYGHGG